MKRKIILALMTICTLSFVSCGKQEATATTESIPCLLYTSDAADEL